MNLHRLCIFKETHHVPLRAYVCPRPKNSPLLLLRSKTTTALLCWSLWNYISPSGPGRGGMLGGRFSHLFLCIVLLKKPSIVGLHAIQLCRNVLVYPRGATDVRCAICGTTTAAPPPANQVAHLNCVQCHPILMYPYGAPCVKCAICNYITNAGMHNMRFPIHVAHRPNEPTPVPPSTSVQSSRASNMTVVVENPMSVNENGKLVSNVVVGVTTGKK